MASAGATLDLQARPVQRALARSAIYRLLSLACAYPSAAGLALLRDEALPVARLGAEVVAPRVGPYLTAMEELLRTDLDSWRLAYHRSFSHVVAADCPPYESAYTARHLFQQTQVMADVSGFYRAFGFQVVEENRERVDHIGVELEFMHLLAHKEAYALVHHGRAKARLCRQAQRRFWRDHLGRWLPAFARLLATKAGDGLYVHLARAATAFAEAEARLLGEAPMPEEPSPVGPGDDVACPWAEDGCPGGGSVR